MADESTATTLVGGINTSFIAKVFSNYAIDNNVLLPRTRYEPVGPGTGTAAFTSTTKGSAAAVTDGTGLSNTALTQAKASVTASEVGILRHITKKGQRFHVLGNGLEGWAIEDGKKLVLEKMETDGLAQFTNASTSSSNTGVAATVAMMLGAISQGAINKMRGAAYFIWSTFQARDIRLAIAASAAPILNFIGGASLMAMGDATGMVGNFAGYPVYETNLALTAGADKIGAFLIDGYKNPENAPTGCALGWMPEPETATTPQMPGRQLAVTACYGFGEISDFNYVKLLSVGT